MRLPGEVTLGQMGFLSRLRPALLRCRSFRYAQVPAPARPEDSTCFAVRFSARPPLSLRLGFACPVEWARIVTCSSRFQTARHASSFWRDGLGFVVSSLSRAFPTSRLDRRSHVHSGHRGLPCLPLRLIAVPHRRSSCLRFSDF